MKSKKVQETGEKLPEGRQMIGCDCPQKASVLSNLHRDHSITPACSLIICHTRRPFCRGRSFTKPGEVWLQAKGKSSVPRVPAQAARLFTFKSGLENSACAIDSFQAVVNEEPHAIQLPRSL